MGRVENGSEGDLSFMNNIIEKRKERDGWSSCLWLYVVFIDSFWFLHSQGNHHMSMRHNNFASTSHNNLSLSLSLFSRVSLVKHVWFENVRVQKFKKYCRYTFSITQNVTRLIYNLWGLSNFYGMYFSSNSRAVLVKYSSIYLFPQVMILLTVTNLDE